MPLAFLCVIVSQLGNPGNDGHLVALQARMASVSNVTAEYDVIDSMSPPEALLSALNDSAKKAAKQDGAATTFSLQSGQQKYAAVFRFSDG
jgi:hypothetical protein